MKITVETDDGKQSASVVWAVLSLTPQEILRSLIQAQMNGQAAELIDAITVTDAPAEPEFKFQVGQRVKNRTRADVTIDRRWKLSDGRSAYRLLYPNGSVGCEDWYDHELEHAE